MKSLYTLALSLLIVGCTSSNESVKNTPANPLMSEFNSPLDYANVTASDIEAYAKITVGQIATSIEEIKNVGSPSFENVFLTMDDINNKMTTASNNCFMLYWVSPDSLSRLKGYAGYQLIDSLSTSMYSDKAIFEKMLGFSTSEDYTALVGNKKLLVDDFITGFKQSGVNLMEDQLAEYKRLNKEISTLTSNYSTNMNANTDILILDEKGAEGLSDNFKSTYKQDNGSYEIPIINATRSPMNNASDETTRKAYFFKFYNRAADTNLDILDQLRSKRHKLAQVMGYPSYAAYNLTPKMAKNPDNVWNFINDLVDRSKDKAKVDLEILKEMKQNDPKNINKQPFQPWDISYYHEQILKTKYQVDNEKIREYLPMNQCLAGVFSIYQNLLGLKFVKVENPSVWHEEIEMYEVFEGDKLKGRFYLDLYPRPNKETWFYAVGLAPGKLTAQGYEVPSSMLLGNFTRATETLPSLLSPRELNTLFHEFGHIMDGMAYEGEFSSQSDSKSDFTEAMSQIFENWIWNYDMLSSFAKHYETGEVLSKETFDNMVQAKNVSSGLKSLRSLRSCIYDMNLYDKHDPEAPVNTDDVWKNIDKELGVMPLHVDGTHYQASWIHINTHPVYYYGYLWSEVYAQDMFTEFEKNGLDNQETGIRYRKLILANGSQRDIVEAVEEFLGRPSNNEAYIRSLGLD